MTDKKSEALLINKKPLLFILFIIKIYACVCLCVAQGVFVCVWGSGGGKQFRFAIIDAEFSRPIPLAILD